MEAVREAAVAAILSASVVMILRRFGDGATAAVATVLALAGLAAVFFSRVAALYHGVLSAVTPAVSAYLPFLGKVLGVSWLCQFASDICREMGSPTLGGYVEWIGKGEILLLCLPPLSDAVESALSLLGT